MNPIKINHLTFKLSKSGAPKAAGVSGEDLKDLHAKIGQLTLERDFLEGQCPAVILDS